MKTSKPNSRFKDIAGQSFGTLTAVRFVGYNESSKQLWEFSCSVCGHTKAKVANSVTTGKGGCGCRQFAGHRRTHGKHGTREYNVWKQMRQRCNNPNAIGYANYGGRGIRVCDRWEDFAAFLADMGPAPSKAHSIERKDNGQGYEPGNCVWATRAEQSRNKRDNHLLTYQGRTQTVVDWAAEVGLTHDCLFKRIRNGWPVHEALTLPAHCRNWKKRPF
jgi:predicted  nucleic acid-binding Zn-ribbon protein